MSDELVLLGLYWLLATAVAVRLVTKPHRAERIDSTDRDVATAWRRGSRR